MGLASLELVVSIEEFFNIEISEQEACKVHTLKDMTKCVASKIKMKKSDSLVLSNISLIFQNAWTALKFPSLHLYTPINTQLSAEDVHQLWKYIKEHHSLKLPKIMTKKALLSDEGALIHACNLNQIIDWTIAINYQTLFKPKHIRSEYEIERIITGILLLEFGITYEEIHPKADLIYDLGLD